MSHPRSKFLAFPALSAIALASLLVSACGGGGYGDKTVQYATSYAAGRIAGFGSIVINGVHYDETAATVLDEDGNVHPSTDLKLGMIAEVQAIDYGFVDNSGTGASDMTSATAQSIVFKSLMQGPVDAIDPVAGTVSVLGQTVAIDQVTVFDAALSGGLASIHVNDVVRIYGLLPSSGGSYTATRVEPLATPSYYVLRGSVTASDAVAQTATIGGAVIDVSALQAAPQPGNVVRFKLLAGPTQGTWVAVGENAGADQPHDADHSDLEGAITSMASATSLSVDGTPVDISQVQLDPATTLGVGTRVQVAGAVIQGVLLATSLTVETDQSIQVQGFEVDGVVDSLDTVNALLVVRGTSISIAGNIVVSGALLTDLKVGSKVEVHGLLASDGVTLNADTINVVSP